MFFDEDELNEVYDDIEIITRDEIVEDDFDELSEDEEEEIVGGANAAGTGGAGGYYVDLPRGGQVSITVPSSLRGHYRHSFSGSGCRSSATANNVYIKNVSLGRGQISCCRVTLYDSYRSGGATYRYTKYIRGK